MRRALVALIIRRDVIAQNKRVATKNNPRRLSFEDERDLLSRIQRESGYKREYLFQSLIEAYHDLIKGEVLKLVSRAHSDYEWLLNSGALGLCEASLSFDLKRKNRFATYAWQRVRKRIQEALGMSRVVIRDVTYSRSAAIQASKAIKEGTEHLLCPEYQEAAELMKLRAQHRSTVYLDHPRRGEAYHEIFLVDGRSPEEHLFRFMIETKLPKIQADVLRKAMEELPDRLRYIVNTRWLSAAAREAKKPISRYLLAKRLGVSGTRVEQLEQQAHEKLRRVLKKWGYTPDLLLSA